VDENDAVSRQSKRLQCRGRLGSYLTRYGPFPASSLPDSSVKPIRFTSIMALARQALLDPVLSLGPYDEESEVGFLVRAALARAVFRLQRFLLCLGLSHLPQPLDNSGGPSEHYPCTSPHWKLQSYGQGLIRKWSTKSTRKFVRVCFRRSRFRSPLYCTDDRNVDDDKSLEPGIGGGISQTTLVLRFCNAGS
jgi:hypothetical protein